MTEALPQTVQLSRQIDISIRPAVETDLRKLEHEGSFTRYRKLFRAAYREQINGRRVMLVADCNNYPVGRLFILFKSADKSIADAKERAYLYSFFVMTPFRGFGIGTAMVRYAERLLRERGFRYITIAVAKDNDGALRLYQRMNYIRVREDDGKWSYTDHRGRTRQVHEPCWILEKTL